MRIRTTSALSGTSRIELAGELDHDCVGLVHDEVLAILAREHPRRIVIDMHLVPLADSAALGTLVSCHRAAAAAGAELTISDPSPFVHRVLWVSGLLGLFGLTGQPSPREKSRTAAS
jgi:anti-anti-sigma factor